MKTEDDLLEAIPFKVRELQKGRSTSWFTASEHNSWRS